MMSRQHYLDDQTLTNASSFLQNLAQINYNAQCTTNYLRSVNVSFIVCIQCTQTELLELTAVQQQNVNDLTLGQSLADDFTLYGNDGSHDPNMNDSFTALGISPYSMSASFDPSQMLPTPDDSETTPE